jgi:hypothetical protein
VLDFKSAKRQALVALYEHIIDDADSAWIPAESVNLRLPVALPLPYLGKALSSLEDEGLIESDEKPTGDVEFSISETGILTVQQTILPDGTIQSSELPEGVTEIPTPRFFTSEGEAPEFPGRPGDIILEMLPAADRLVPINHNSASYTEIANQLEQLERDVHGANSFDLTDGQRSRLLQSLKSARALWAASELKYVQLKVGLIMVVEEVAELFKGSQPAITAGLVVEAIKAFVQTALGGTH